MARYVFLPSRDGWVTKFDLWNLKVVAEVRPGSTRNAAVSGDGKWVAVANYLPHSLGHPRCRPQFQETAAGEGQRMAGFVPRFGRL